MPIPTPPPVNVPGSGIEFMFAHTVSVERFAGAGPYGDVYDDPVAINCFLDDGVHLVRDASGQEVASSGTVYAAQGALDLLAPGSRVALNGRLATVITTNSRSSGALRLPDHVEAHLT